MNKKFIAFASVAGVAILGVSIFGSTKAKWAVTDNADPLGLQIVINGETHTVNFYSTFTNSWTSPDSVQVVNGASVNVPEKDTYSGYTFKGWKTSAPSVSDVAITYTDAQVEALSITADLNLYAVYESNANYAYTNNEFFDVDNDITISSNSITATTIGKRYVGVTNGIPNPVASWNDTRSLYSASGKYKFVNENGAAMIYRKIGFKPNSSWGASWNGDPGFGVYSWDGNGNDVSIHMGQSNGSTTLYAYIPADFINFKFSRYSHNETDFVWSDNQSGDLSFDSSWYWSGSSTNKYSSSTFVLTMNSWNNWVDNWGSNDSQWA